MRSLLAVAVTYTVVSILGCSAAEDDTGNNFGAASCEPGQPYECACSNGAPGVQQCDATGSSFSPCSCGGEAPGTGGLPASGGFVGAGGSTPIGTGGVATGTGGTIPAATGGNAGAIGSGGTEPIGTGGTEPIGAGGTEPIGTGGTEPVGTGGAEPGGTHWERGPAPTSASASARGPYNVATYTSGMRDGPAYADATMHYPTDAEPPFAGVAVVPGFVSPQSSIRPWGPFLASHGIVTLTIGTNSPTDYPDARARALLDAIETIRSESDRSGSPLQGNIEKSRMAVMGWSMGGGGTLIAANTTPTLKAAISLCGWNPGARYTQNTVPSLMFAAVNDGLAGGQSQGFYSSIPATTPKILYEVNPGSHSVANDPANQRGEIGRYGLSWMKVFLEGDERYRQFLQQRPTQPVRAYESNIQ